MTNERSMLLASIAATTRDYREDEAGIVAPTPEHVERWIRQFDEDNQLPLLRELDHVLESTYLSKADVTAFLDRLVTNVKLVSGEPHEFWSTVNFLNIQKNGRSQKALLGIFDGCLHDAIGLHVWDCGAPTGPYLYLDDVVFSGNRAGEDLSAWVADKAPAVATLHVVVGAVHALGCWQLESRLETEAKTAGKTILVHVWRGVSFENRKAYRMHSEVLWPIALPDDELVRQYAESIEKFPFEPRPPGGKLEKPIFSSEQGRQLLEREFLLAGVRIRAACRNPAEVIRPLGFSHFGLGFGSMIVTFRNCPNNAPLALWWGEPDARPGSALDWYPLFPRKTYDGD
jgi:hypothetical protein